ncbi:MAG: DUF2079 domain-containing protein [Ktedonobacteraceae bacterium]|nr:DUF2079 domain-containing protein [Ktedonobacteraceae bacterium]
MTNATWRKRFSVLRNRLYLYPAPEPMPHRRFFWLAMGLVTLAAIAFSTYFIVYLVSMQNAFQLNAEDMGIMDQAIWSTVHGQVLHQTICNILHDSNCGGFNGVSRFALHFEPILFPVSLFYLIWADPRTLLILQVLVVAAGAYPAFWLARLRLRNDLAAVAIALIYLLYPALQQATAIDFHAVTFTASFLLFTLYFMYTRRTVWLFVFALLSILCKEEIGVVIAMFGLWSMVFQRRWKTGLALVVIGSVTSVLAILIIIPHFSPTGQPMLGVRYGAGPVQTVLGLVTHPKTFLHQYLLEHNHLAYLRSLFAPGAFLPLLAPWILIMAVPSIAANLLSSDPQQYTGLFHYNAEIVPVLIFALIEAMVLILWVVQWVITRLQAQAENATSDTVSPTQPAPAWRPVRILHIALLFAMLCFVLFTTVRRDDTFFGKMPFAENFQWPTSSAHMQLAQHFIDMVPPDASISAQTKLVPHLSHRSTIYMFPYGTPFDSTKPASISTGKADYVLLDLEGDVYPYYTSQEYINGVKTVLLNGDYGILAAQDGYLLLKRGLPQPGISPYSALPAAQVSDPLLQYLLLPNLPTSLCSDIYVAPKDAAKRVQATFTSPGSGSLSLLDYNVKSSSTINRTSGITVTTEWRVNAPITTPMQFLFLMTGSDGKEYFVSNDVSQLFWCQTNTWKPGSIVRLTSRTFTVNDSKVPYGLAHLSLALLPLVQSSDKIMEVQARLPVHAENISSPVTPTPGTNALQLKSINIIP